jgi:paraquat-inducible protein B
MSSTVGPTKPAPEPGQGQVQAPAQATVRRGRRVSIVWAIPIITLLLGGYLVWDTLSKRGPTITIQFKAGEGLVAGQSHIKHLDVDLGQVTRVVLSPDASHVEVTAEMKREATPFLTDKARLWVVTPRLFAGSISGLDTLISGAYIELLPSNAADRKTGATAFVGLEEPPVLTTNAPGREFVLDADKVGAVSVGSPVFYRGLNVGTVLGWDLADMARQVKIHAFVQAPYDSYVHEETKFWNASGISVNFGANGLQVQMESFRALLLGGVAFDTDAVALKTPAAAADHVFPLFDNQKEADDASYTLQIPSVAYFPGSVAGLSAGSPVTYHGLTIGEVTRITLEYDPATDLLRTPVYLTLQPERIANSEEARARGPLANAQFLVNHGMRLQITSSNLLTGSMQVAMDIFPSAAPAQVTVQDGVYVLPTVGGTFSDLGKSVTAIMNQLNKLPFDQIGASLTSLLNNANQLTSGPETKQAIRSLTATLQAAQSLVQNLNTEATPALKDLPKMTADLQAMLANTNKLVQSAQSGYGEDSKFHRNLDQMMQQLSDMVQSLRVLADLLDRHPEALIRGRTNTGQE